MLLRCVKLGVQKGQIFGRLTLLKFARRGNENRIGWVCQCACGKRIWADARDLARGHTKSCGCWRVEHSRAKATTHGLSKTPAYGCWNGMIQRCLNPNDPDFRYYGGRGIKVCREWRKFEGFLKSMGPRPSSKHTLERMNNNGHYRPGNVRWATRLEQGQNTRKNRMITFEGETLCASEMACRHGLTPQQLAGRFYWGWSVKRALTQPLKKYHH